MRRSRGEGEKRAYVVLRQQEIGGEEIVQRLGMVHATSRDAAEEAVRENPGAYFDALEPGVTVEMAVMPASAWPEFQRMAPAAHIILERVIAEAGA